MTRNDHNESEGTTLASRVSTLEEQLEKCLCELEADERTVAPDQKTLDELGGRANE